MAMSEQRLGEIAYAVLMAKLKKEGLTLSGSTLRQLGSLSQETGIPKEDLRQFTEHILRELVGNALGYNEVSLTLGGRISDNKKD